ncbi:MAG: pilus assembly protein [Proteobacteria bacterium]|nr:pilus assembly protein [Pseudomonadota bacterium]
MKNNTKHITPIKRFIDDCDGVVLVEFAILLPMLLLVFAIMIEGSRLMWSYQSTISAVRDATRYLARVAPVDICSSGGSVAGYSGDLMTIIAKNIDGTTIFPTGITVDAVVPTLTCTSGAFRVNPAPVVQVSASITVNFIFGAIFSLSGGSLSSVTTTISDQSRVFGT